MIIRPMLASRCRNIESLKYPILATPKIDGIRCLIVNGEDGKPKAVSRNFKPIPNHHVRGWLENHCSIGFDGELVVPGGTFQETSSVIMSRSGEPQFSYQVFDYWADHGGSYRERVDKMTRAWELCAMEHNQFPGHHFQCGLVLPELVVDVDQLNEFEAACISDGYEGVIIRDPNGPYKFGRSTEKEGYLLKIKRFEDGDAVIVGFEEKMHNANEAELDELGRTKRSSHKANQIPMNTLGALTVKDTKTGVQFQVGTGFTDEMRDFLWSVRSTLIGKIIKYKSQPHGVLDKPRFPVFLGLRSSI
jgi:DNA ligase 1